jgi:hypothetical protein
MGKSITPKYRVEVRENIRKSSLPCSAQMCWTVGGNYGKGSPTNENLAEWHMPSFQEF